MDGGLSQSFQKHLPEIHWQRIETLIGRGTPDLNGCLWGRDFWIENKATDGWAVNFEMGQTAWHERRVRAGGRVFLAVRRKAIAGPRRGDAVDELYLFRGQETRFVEAEGLKSKCPVIGIWPGGPAKWGWDAIRKVLAG